MSSATQYAYARRESSKTATVWNGPERPVNAGASASFGGGMSSAASFRFGSSALAFLVA